MSLTEFEIIARYFAHHDARADVLLGVGDDAAVLEAMPGRKLVVALDTIVEGVHFPAGTAAADVGHRALAVNLSDLAAMGAQPSWMLLSVSMPQADEQWVAGFAAGLLELARQHGVVLVGGDMVRGPLAITVQIGGWVEPDGWLTRAGARPGDQLWVSGIPGEAAAGLAVLQQSLAPGAAATHLAQRFLRPQPRIALGRRLRLLASAAMDVSDGLLTDIEKLCAASGCAAQLDIDALPASSAMSELFGASECVQLALAGGDDYELVFTVPPQHAAQLRASAELPLAQIGVISAGSGVQCIRQGRPFAVARRGYDHFA